MADANPRQRVRSADNMSLEDFEMHVNMRHGDSLGSLDHLTLRENQQYVNLCWRKFHDQIHKLRLSDDLDHHHGPYRPNGERVEQQGDRTSA